MKMKVLKIATDAAPELVELPNELHALQEAVGGHIEVVHLMTEGDLMIVDEEGLIKGREPNKTATILAQQPIYGDALVVSEQGEDFGDVDPEIVHIVTHIHCALADESFSEIPAVKVPINYIPGQSKRFILATRAKLLSDDETLNELRAAIVTCENELTKGTHLHQEDLFLYCAAMQNLTTSLETQMDEFQKKAYKRLLEKTKVVTTVAGLNGGAS
jgi:hypothetical protein